MVSDLLRILRHAIVGLITGHCELKLHLYRSITAVDHVVSGDCMISLQNMYCSTVAVLSRRELFTFDELVKGRKIPEEEGLVRGI